MRINPKDGLCGYPALAVLYHLVMLNVAAAIRAQPDARYVVVQNGSSVTLELFQERGVGA